MSIETTGPVVRGRRRHSSLVARARANGSRPIVTFLPETRKKLPRREDASYRSSIDGLPPDIVTISSPLSLRVRGGGDDNNRCGRPWSLPELSPSTVTTTTYYHRSDLTKISLLSRSLSRVIARTGPDDETEQSDRVVWASCTVVGTMSSALSRGRDCGRGNDALRLGTHDCARPECGGVRARTIAAAAARAAASLVVASARRRRRRPPRERCRRRSYLRCVHIYIIINVFFLVSFSLFFHNPSTAPPPHDPRRRLPTVAERRATPSSSSSRRTVFTRVTLPPRLAVARSARHPPAVARP